MEENSRCQLFFSGCGFKPGDTTSLTMGVERLMGFRLSLSHKLHIVDGLRKNPALSQTRAAHACPPGTASSQEIVA